MEVRIAIGMSLACLIATAGACGRIGFGLGGTAAGDDAPVGDSGLPGTDGDGTVACGPRAGQLLELHLDEMTGIVAHDSSGAGHDGTLSGGPRWASGKFNGGVAFDGVNDNLSTFANPATLNDLGSMTVCAWVKSDQITDPFSILFDKSLDGYSQGWNLYTTSNTQGVDGRYGLFVNTGAFVEVNGVVAGTWQHVCGTWDGSFGTAGLRIYVDGTPRMPDVEEVGRGTVEIDAAHALSIGRSSNGRIPFTGSLDELRLFDRTLSPSEVATLFACP